MDEYVELAPTIVMDNAVDGYPDILEYVYRHGDMVAPRDKVTFEIMGLMVVSKDPTTNMIPTGEHREFLESEIKTVKKGELPEMKASKELIERLDLQEDGTFFEDGIRDSIGINWDDWVERLRKEDASSRKIATVFTDPIELDPPCTMFMQMLVRNRRLHLFTVNRSQDLLFAYPMDIGLFETLQCEMVEALSEVNQIDIGIHKHFMVSAHLYEEQYEEWHAYF